MHYIKYSTHYITVQYAVHYSTVCTTLQRSLHYITVQYALHYSTVYTTLLYSMHFITIHCALHYSTLCTTLLYSMHYITVQYALHYNTICTNKWLLFDWYVEWNSRQLNYEYELSWNICSQRVKLGSQTAKPTLKENSLITERSSSQICSLFRHKVFGS